MTAEDIRADLTPGKGRPEWIFSAYGPGKDAPRQLFGGPMREISPEELRLRHYEAAAAGNMHVAIQEAQKLHAEALQQMENILKDLKGAVKYIKDGEKEHPNRNDIVQGKIGPQPGFGKPAGPFGQPQQQQAPAFGKPGFGQPAFGQPAFGKPGFGGQQQQQSPAFGKPGFGQPAFGKPAFGQPAFGQTGFAQQAAPAFGQQQQQQQQQTGPAFGQTSAPGFGQTSAQSPFAAAAAAAAANQQATGFGQQQPAATGGFGTQQPQQQQQQAQAAPPFGQPQQQPAAAGGFAAQTQTTAAPATTAEGKAPLGPKPILKVGDNELSPLPDLNGPTTRDATNKLTMWKGRPVQYKNDVPCYLHPGDNKTYVRIFFPDGPPEKAVLKDIEGQSDEYTPEIKEAYEFFLKNGYFKDEVIPPVPPKTDWVGFDF